MQAKRVPSSHFHPLWRASLVVVERGLQAHDVLLQSSEAGIDLELKPQIERVFGENFEIYALPFIISALKEDRER